MPRTMDALLRQVHERANPQTRIIAEVSAPDAGQVLRRWTDQFSVNPPRLSESPGGSSVNTPSGALTLTAADLLLASKYTAGGDYNLPVGDVSKVLRGVAWTPDATMGRVMLRSFVARIKRISLLGIFPSTIDLQLQIYRPTAVVGSLIRQVGGATITTPAKQWSFAEQLPQPSVVKYAAITWDGTQHADVTFDLKDFALEVGPFGTSPDGAPVEERPYLLFVISPVGAPLDGLFDWRVDTTSGITVASVGTFRDATWSRSDSNNALGWGETLAAVNVPCFKLNVLDYSATSQLVYLITLPSVPVSTSVGRIVFERALPSGTAVTLELSTAGSGGPWTVVTHGDIVAIKQLTYHLRVTLNASADHRRAPSVPGVGIEFRIPVDVSAEGVAEPLSHEIGVPFLQAAIAEGSLKIVRTGRRDYHDPATELAVNYPTTKLEVDLYLASLHPSITRARWLHLDRAAVSSRSPVETSETLTMLSVAKSLKRKIPDRIESINKVHTVTGSPAVGQVQVTPNLQGTTATGNEYDAKGYYLRVRSSAATGLPPGYIHTIDGNTNVDKLDFVGGNTLPGVFNVGDVIEVHSGVYAQPALSWKDADPADIWWEILTVHRAIPTERIGRGDLGRAGRSGLPPKVTDRAPGDATTQAKLKVTVRLSEAENADELLDQLSFHMGGATMEIGGQFVFRQIYPLRDPNNALVVAPDAPACVFDVRDFTGLETPPAVEQRITTISCDYGIDLTGASPDTQPTRTTVVVDADAVAWLTTQDVDGLGATQVPDNIARWCYNSSDQGLYLATLLCRQVVFACSTGLRVWGWRTVEAKPELCVGDIVTVITDRYTDYDPARKLPIVGTWAFSLVLVQVAGGGRMFRGFMLGLASARRLKGGAPGTLGAQPFALYIDVSPSEAPTQTVFTPLSNGVVEYKIDSAVWTVLGASTLTVTRNAANGPSKQVQFRATSGGQIVAAPGAFNVPPQVATPPGPAITDLGAWVSDYDTDDVTVAWNFTGLAAGSYMVVERNYAGTGYVVASGHLTNAPFVDAVPQNLVDTGGSAVAYDYRVKMYDVSNVQVAISSVYTLNTLEGL